MWDFLVEGGGCNAIIQKIRAGFPPMLNYKIPGHFQYILVVLVILWFNIFLTDFILSYSSTKQHHWFKNWFGAVLNKWWCSVDEYYISHKSSSKRLHSWANAPNLLLANFRNRPLAQVNAPKLFSQFSKIGPGAFARDLRYIYIYNIAQIRLYSGIRPPPWNVKFQVFMTI